MAQQVIAPLIPEGALQVVRRRNAKDRGRWPGDVYRFLVPDFADALRAAGLDDQPEQVKQASVRGTQVALLRHGHLAWRVESRASHAAEHAIIYRFPLLDRRIVEYALGLPATAYVRRGQSRYLYRLALDGILPDDIRWFNSKVDTAIEAQQENYRIPMLELLLEKIAGPSGR